MSLKNDRQRVAVAAATLTARRYALQKKSDWLFDGFERWQPALLVGSGLIAGLFIGRGKLNNATRSVISAAGLSMAFMRSSLGSMLLARTAFHGRPSKTASPRHRDDKAQG